jgi:hypothetical protein
MKTEEINKYIIDERINIKEFKEYEGSRASFSQINNSFSNLLKNGEAFCAAKLGTVEVMSLRQYLIGKEGETPTDYRPVARMMHINAGIFPPSQEGFDEFNDIFLSYLGDLDFFGMWMFGEDINSITEKEIYEKYSPNAKLVSAGCWDPFTLVLNGEEDPWTKGLEGKTVLVVSPFTETIKEQYKKREKIWKNPSILPEFNLKMIKVPLSAGLKKSKFFSWTDGLDNMKEQMNSTEFDVCFVGAGAWGLPLAVHAKRLGKIGIHSGGDLQLMFGINGKRWDDNEFIQKSNNSFWTRPSKEETPNNKEHIENGCYW